MSSVISLSRLESLPPEIFNRVLYYVFDSVQARFPESITRSRGHVFDTAILRVNKSIHNISKSYLHHSLSWIRIDINWGMFFINPHWLGVPYTTISSDAKCQQLEHQAAPGRIVVRVKFPSPLTRTQYDIEGNCVKPPLRLTLSVLVLEQDLANFVDVLRMNELAYCCRLLSGPQTTVEDLTKPSDKGLSLSIEIRSGLEEKRYKHLLSIFTKLSGPFHQLTIKGHSDPAHAAALKSMVELPRQDPDQMVQITRAQSDTYYEAIKICFSLKHRGDLCLKLERHASAQKYYYYADVFEQHWRSHSPQSTHQTFWHRRHNVYISWYLALICNQAILHVTADEIAPRATRSHTDIRTILSVLDNLFTTTGKSCVDRRLETVYALMFSHILQQYGQARFDNKETIEGLYACLGSLTSLWDRWHMHSHLDSDSSPIKDMYSHAIQIMDHPRVVHTHAAALVDDGSTETVQEDITTGIKEHIDAMRLIMRKAKFGPLVWGIRKELFPQPLTAQWMDGWPTKTVVQPSCVLQSTRKRGESKIEPTRPGRSVRIECSIPRFDEVNRELLRYGGKEERIFV